MTKKFQVLCLTRSLLALIALLLLGMHSPVEYPVLKATPLGSGLLPPLAALAWLSP